MVEGGGRFVVAAARIERGNPLERERLRQALTASGAAVAVLFEWGRLSNRLKTTSRFWLVVTALAVWTTKAVTTNLFLDGH